MSGCEFDGCGRARYCRGWCVMHYARWRAHGDPGVVYVQTKSPCNVDGCPKLAHAHGYCYKHLARWKKHGDPLFEAPILGRPLKGVVLSFAGVHKRLARQRGSARTFACVDCGASAREWSYDGRDPDELIGFANGFEMAYSLDLGHYEPRCVSCHRRFDGAGVRDRKADGTFARKQAG